MKISTESLPKDIKTWLKSIPPVTPEMINRVAAANRSISKKDKKMKNTHGYETLVIQIDDIYAAISGLNIGIELGKESLAAHIREFGKISRKDRMYADQLEQDLICMKGAVKRLQKRVEENVDKA